MQNVQKVFTLIELVVVIVLLGILGVTALAKFQDLSGEAQNAANAGVAAELSSGSSINYAAYSLSTALGTPITNLTSCPDAATALMTLKPAGYNFNLSGAVNSCTAGTTFECLVDGGGTAASAIVLCTN